MSAEDPRLRRASDICRALPEVVRQLTGRHAAFTVRKKTFAYYLDDHHGDGIVAVTCKVEAGANDALVASDPARFYLPPYLSSKGWIALRLDVGPVDWEEVRQLLTDSYRLIAPKVLVRSIIVRASGGGSGPALSSS
jgi:phosphoribosylglycinamide formyltransferase-1